MGSSLGGRRLYIATGDGKSPDGLLYPVADDALEFPAQEAAPNGTLVVPDTLADKLAQRPTPWALRMALGGIAAIAAISAAIVIPLTTDSAPPEFQKVIAENDPNSVTVVFDEPLDSTTVAFNIESASSAGGFGVTPPFLISDEDGRPVTVHESSRHPQLAERVILKTAPLKIGRYQLRFSGVKDVSGNRDEEEESTYKFEFRDTMAIELLTVSSDGQNPNDLILKFRNRLIPTMAAIGEIMRSRVSRSIAR